MTAKKYGVYLGNAMTNIPAFNFPWFFEAEAWLLANTHITAVANPARKDLEKIPLEEMQTIPGYDTGDLPTYVANSSFTMANAMEWDLPAILRAHGIVLGDGWPTSTGARYERLVAEALGRDIWLLHGTSDADFELERDPAPLRLTNYLKRYKTVEQVINEEIDAATGANLHLATPRELLAEVRKRYPHAQFREPLDKIESQLA
jgi:Domain of unknown function (DUF4406)